MTNSTKASSKLMDTEVRLDVETPLEWFFIILGIAGIIATIAQIADPADRNPMYILGGIATTVFSFYARSNIDCTYIINNMMKILYYRRTIFGYTTENPVCNFSDIHAVTVQGHYKSQKHGGHWDYWVVLILKSGKTIDVSDSCRHNDGFKTSSVFAEELATHFDVIFFAGEPEQSVTVALNPQTGKVEVSLLDKSTVSPILILLFILLVGGMIYLGTVMRQ